MKRPDRILISVRLAKTGVVEIDRLAAARQLDRSSMIRILLSQGIAAEKAKKGEHRG